MQTDHSNTLALPVYGQIDMVDALEQLSDLQLDQLDYGVIGFDDESIVRRYNACESRLAGISVERVIGQSLFKVVAPCMNNYMVALRFEEALETKSPLDDTIKYVLTLRMRATSVNLRLLASPHAPMRYILVDRRV
jgi:photoactive yellow protein